MRLGLKEGELDPLSVSLEEGVVEAEGLSLRERESDTLSLGESVGEEEILASREGVSLPLKESVKPSVGEADGEDDAAETQTPEVESHAAPLPLNRDGTEIQLKT